MLSGSGHYLVPGGDYRLVLGGVGALAGDILRIPILRHGGSHGGLRDGLLGSFLGGGFFCGLCLGHSFGCGLRHGLSHGFLGGGLLFDAKQNAQSQNNQGYRRSHHQGSPAGLEPLGLCGIVLAAAGADGAVLRHFRIAKRTVFHFFGFLSS